MAAWLIACQLYHATLTLLPRVLTTASASSISLYSLNSVDVILCLFQPSCFLELCHPHAFSHYEDLYSASTRLLIGGAPDLCMARKNSFLYRLEQLGFCPNLLPQLVPLFDVCCLHLLVLSHPPSRRPPLLFKNLILLLFLFKHTTIQ